uniref:G_PROTEIN_RECEP_F1_2 domain-containing protein n=1 Tax=Angiostrongylus cantonensis TaxID=6313 RepID=A0A0K0D5X6_ANGCA
LILPLKLYRIYVLSYWVVFSPLFIASAFNCYFVFIVFVRSVFEYKDFKGPTLRFGFNAMRLALIALFEVLLCYKVEGDFEHGQVAVRSSYGIVFTPIWILCLVLCIQTCRLF